MWIFLLVSGLAESLRQQQQHLVVTVHGLGGFATDLGYLRRRLEEEKGVAVLACKCNERKTFDGIAAGGRRVAEEVADYLKTATDFETISFVGNSLGGLYSRYALALLADEDGDEETFAGGLKPAAFVTTAAPHLGIRSALYSSAIAPFAWMQSARDVLGQTDLLSDMVGPTFLKPLASFRERRAYAAVRGDFMVPFDSALFTSSAPASFFGGKQRKTTSSTSVQCVGATQTQQGRKVPMRREDEEIMARALEDLGWSRCLITLPRTHTILDLLPLSHNKVVALERSGIKRAFSVFEQTSVGQPVMDNLATWISRVAAETSSSSTQELSESE